MVSPKGSLSAGCSISIRSASKAQISARREPYDQCPPGLLFVGGCVGRSRICGQRVSLVRELRRVGAANPAVIRPTLACIKRPASGLAERPEWGLAPCMRWTTRVMSSSCAAVPSFAIEQVRIESVLPGEESTEDLANALAAH
jgi:hypothetical protein